MTSLWMLGAVLVVATAFGLWRKATDGRVRHVSAREVAAPGLTALDLGADLGAKATLVQFSTAFCAPCRATRVTLGQIVDMIAGVRHIEVDAEDNLELVRRLDVRRTPTVLILDRSGHVRTRAAGAPRKADVIAALGEFL